MRGYFAELFERLQQQEVAATAVVDAFVRERLATLKQQQEDLNTLLAQISTVCMQCEQTLVQASDIYNGLCKFVLIMSL